MKAWEDFLIFLEGIFGKSTIAYWLKTFKVTHFDACHIYLESPDTFRLNWYREHVHPIAQKKFRTPSGHPIKVIFLPLKKIRKQKYSSIHREDEIVITSEHLKEEALFEQYIVSFSNKNSFDKLCYLLGYPSNGKRPQKYHQQPIIPIYVYGPCGSGKTHLTMAATKFLQSSGFRTFYVTAETFTTHFLEAMSKGQMQKFREAYRNVDVLIIENIEILSRKQATQEEFFHTFNTLHISGKQIILSASLHPRLLEHIEERIINRLEWGITLFFDSCCSEELLKQIIKKRSEYYRTIVNPSLLNYMAKKSPSIHSAIKGLQHIIKSSAPSLSSSPLTLKIPLIEQSFLRILQQEQSLSPEIILSSIAKLFGQKIEDFNNQSQAKDATFPRHLAMYLMRKELKMSYIKIGDILHRDHSTVISGIQKIHNLLETRDPWTLHYIQKLQIHLKTHNGKTM